MGLGKGSQGVWGSTCGCRMAGCSAMGMVISGRAVVGLWLLVSFRVLTGAVSYKGPI